MAKTEQIQKWVDGLTPEQMRPLLVTLTELACEVDYVHVGEFPPYWAASGDPLVEGQEAWKVED